MSKLFTDEIVQFVKDNYLGLHTYELTNLVNERFNGSYTDQQIRALKNRHKLRNGIKAGHRKGEPTWNKGKKATGKHLETMKRNAFKPGQIAHNTRQIGDEYMERRGYVYVKVSDGPGAWYDNWKLKHVLIYEQNFGPIPEGYAVIFGDGDRTNFDPNNLVLVTTEELLWLGRNDGIYKDADLTKVNALVARLECTIKKKTKEG